MGLSLFGVKNWSQNRESFFHEFDSRSSEFGTQKNGFRPLMAGAFSLQESKGSFWVSESKFDTTGGNALREPPRLPSYQPTFAPSCPSPILLLRLLLQPPQAYHDKLITINMAEIGGDLEGTSPAYENCNLFAFVFVILRCRRIALRCRMHWHQCMPYPLIIPPLVTTCTCTNRYGCSCLR
jgi:hypothetical protein